MNTIQLTGNHCIGFTPISNSFIEHYMPTANGSYVKVYLYLLKRLYSGDLGFDLSDLADRLDNTEKDILRALNYWQKQNLLIIKVNKDKKIEKIVITSPGEKQGLMEMAASNEDGQVHAVPERTEYTPEQISALTADEELKLLLGLLEQYMNQPLPSNHVQLVLYLYENAGLSFDLILHLYEHCLSKNKKTASYIEAVALSWLKKGIDTVDKAETFSSLYVESYSSVMKSFGLNRSPADIEKKFIDKWLTDGFDISLIVEACNRTILNTQKPDFKYTDGILNNWKKLAVGTKEDIAKTDEAHNHNKSKAKNHSKTKKPTGQFQNFPQRQYSSDDYSSLEQKQLKRTWEIYNVATKTST